jgi:hypothetical protein
VRVERERLISDHGRTWLFSGAQLGTNLEPQAARRKKASSGLRRSKETARARRAKRKPREA